ncbi:MAG: hypothetical protein EPO68_12785, partial [Planctomycetota bacterium]
MLRERATTQHIELPAQLAERLAELGRCRRMIERRPELLARDRECLGRVPAFVDEDDAVGEQRRFALRRMVVE